MYRFFPSLLILPIILRVDSLEPVVSVVGNLVVVVILFSVETWAVMIHEWQVW